MAIRVIKEVNRDAGRTVYSGAAIVAGQPLELVTDSNTVQPFSGNGTSQRPLGLASESNYMFPLQAAGGATAGAGYDYTNFNRGGLVGCFVNGGEFTLSNDGSGYPYASGDTYALNGLVYASAAGLVSSTPHGDPIGSVMAITGSAPVTSLTIKSFL